VYHAKKSMPILKLIALAIFIHTLTAFSLAQSGKTAGESSSKVSTGAIITVPDDQTFAAYQRVSNDMHPPRARHAPDPKYPEIPADEEANGVVVMQVGINSKGRVELVHVLRSSNAAFEASAVTTVRTWRFSPAKKDGAPVPVQVTVEMRFQK
jgi:TonB family protein